MSNDNHYDVIIIGTGAGGGTLARKLAPTGKRVLLLERGAYVPREKENWSTRAVNVQGKYQAKEVWRDRDGNPLHPPHELLRRRQHKILRGGAIPAAAGGLWYNQASRRSFAGVAHCLRRSGILLHPG